jgi:hypothetical protein
MYDRVEFDRDKRRAVMECGNGGASKSCQESDASPPARKSMSRVIIDFPVLVHTKRISGAFIGRQQGQAIDLRNKGAISISKGSRQNSKRDVSQISTKEVPFRKKDQSS